MSIRMNNPYPSCHQDTAAWRRVLPNPSVIDFAAEPNSFSDMTTTDLQKAREHCTNVRNHMQLDFSCMFWSTQSKASQLRFREKEDINFKDFANDRDHFLCFRCAQWIPDVALCQHLPFDEMLGLCISHIANCHLVQDKTKKCHVSASYQYSREDSNYWHTHYLNQSDWPSFCQNCKCMVMHTTLPLHNNHNFCNHAKLARSMTNGTFSKSRFCHYPGHPLHHLFYVGRWPVMTLLALRQRDACLMDFLFGILTRTQALASFGGNLDALSVKSILAFIVPSSGWNHRAFLSETCEDVISMVLGGVLQTAMKYLCLLARANGSFQRSDRLGLSD